jgi:hypothetical protein
MLHVERYFSLDGRRRSWRVRRPARRGADVVGGREPGLGVGADEGLVGEEAVEDHGAVNILRI